MRRFLCKLFGHNNINYIDEGVVQPGLIYCTRCGRFRVQSPFDVSNLQVLQKLINKDRSKFINALGGRNVS